MEEKKKIVIKHFVDPLTPHQILQEGAGEIGLTGLVIVMYPVMERERERETEGLMSLSTPSE